MSLELRAATAADREAIWTIWREVIAAGDAFAYDAQTTRDQALGFWVDSSACCKVAVQDGVVMGTYYLRPNQPGRGAHVANAGYMVARAGQGRGVGRALGVDSIAEARRLGFSAMQFNLVVATNGPAVRLWQDLGFRIIGTIPRAFDHITLGRVDAHVMHRFLDDPGGIATD
jgi:L-amino acid N-acyltransferase YncA